LAASARWQWRAAFFTMMGWPVRPRGWVTDRQVHRNIASTFPGNEQNVRRALPIADINLLGRRNGSPEEDVEDGVPQGIVAPRIAVLRAAHKMVAKRVHRFPT
jgi:hypothetical protein